MDLIVILAGVYFAIAIFLFFYLYSVGEYLFTRLNFWIFITVLCLFWPVTLTLYFIDVLRGRVA